MEGVGARLGRSSSRYGTTTVFSSPVRKWKKKWVHVTPSNNASSKNHIHSFANGTNDSNSGSCLLLYKWTPISQSSSSSENKNNNNEDKNSGEDAAAALTEEPPMRINYIPIAVLDEQKMETGENTHDKAEPIDADTSKPTLKNGHHDRKLEIDDMPEKRSQQDLNISTLESSIGLTSRDEEKCYSDQITDQTNYDQPERVDSGSSGTCR